MSSLIRLTIIKDLKTPPSVQWFAGADRRQAEHTADAVRDNCMSIIDEFRLPDAPGALVEFLNRHAVLHPDVRCKLARAPQIVVGNNENGQ